MKTNKLKLLTFLIMAYVTISSQVTVGNVRFKAITSAEIDKGINTIPDVAKVELPRAMTKDGIDIIESLEVGQPCTIELGYNDELQTEFKGYLKPIKDDMPIVLEMEDEAYQLRQATYNEVFPEITLKELLTKIAPGYEIECPKVNLGKFEIDNASGFKVLKELQKQYGFYTFFNGNLLKVGFPYLLRDNATVHVYDLQGGFVEKNQEKLKYKKAGDVKMLIRAISNKKDGKKVIKEYGDNGGSVCTRNYGDVDDSQLMDLAKQEYNRLNYDGLEGSIEGFGIPRTNPGDAIEIKNAEYDIRTGTYLVDAVTIKWGNAFFKRVNKLSYSI